jgi:predicted nuclease with TOPRIM domain
VEVICQSLWLYQRQFQRVGKKIGQQKEKTIMKDKLPNIIMEGKSPTIRIFNIRVLFSLDEERGYLLDTEEMRRQFEEKLSKLEDEVSELNETWQEKQKEYAEDIGPIYTL